MTPSLWHRHEHQQERLLLSTLLTCGVVEYDDRPIDIKPENLTGPARREALRRKLEKL